jgi:hypothetical protein
MDFEPIRFTSPLMVSGTRTKDDRWSTSFHFVDSIVLYLAHLAIGIF